MSSSRPSSDPKMHLNSQYEGSIEEREQPVVRSPQYQTLVDDLYDMFNFVISTVAGRSIDDATQSLVFSRKSSIVYPPIFETFIRERRASTLESIRRVLAALEIDDRTHSRTTAGVMRAEARSLAEMFLAEIENHSQVHDPIVEVELQDEVNKTSVRAESPDRVCGAAVEVGQQDLACDVANVGVRLPDPVPPEADCWYKYQDVACASLPPPPPGFHGPPAGNPNLFDMIDYAGEGNVSSPVQSVSEEEDVDDGSETDECSVQQDEPGDWIDLDFGAAVMDDINEAFTDENYEPDQYYYYPPIWESVLPSCALASVVEALTDEFWDFVDRGEPVPAEMAVELENYENAIYTLRTVGL